MILENLAALDPAKTARLDDVPSKAALLDQLNRSSDMTQRTSNNKTGSSTPPRPQRRGLLVAAAAFIAVIAVLGVVALVGGDNSSQDEVATEADPSVATTAAPSSEATDPLAEATAAVQEMVDTYNTGNVATWLTSFTEEAEIYTADEDGDPVLRQESLMLANSHWELIGCTENDIQFDGPYPTLACDLTLTDDFVGRFLSPTPFAVTYRFTVDTSDDISQMVDLSGEWWIKQERFVEAFNLWLEEAYPEVDGQFRPRLYGGLPAVEDMPTALDYIEEFVAQSDTYPLR